MAEGQQIREDGFQRVDGNEHVPRRFHDFRGRVAASAPAITVRPPTETGLPGGFDVTYDSPSQGRVTFGWEAPLTVDGVEIPQRDFPRYDNPWSQTAFNTSLTAIDIDGFGVRLDFSAGTREVFAE